MTRGHPAYRARPLTAMAHVSPARESDEQGEEMELSVDMNREKESREVTPDGEEEKMSPGPALMEDEEGHLDDGEEERGGQTSGPPHQAPAASGKKISSTVCVFEAFRP